MDTSNSPTKIVVKAKTAKVRFRVPDASATGVGVARILAKSAAITAKVGGRKKG